jgi:hypothetical protein
MIARERAERQVGAFVDEVDLVDLVDVHCVHGVH